MLSVIYSFTVSCSTHLLTNSQPNPEEINSGYSALLLFMENQQNLVTLTNVRSFLSFQIISDESAQLIKTISKSSSQALHELRQLVLMEPAVVIGQYPDDSIGKATFDSLRMTIAKELIFDSKDFEKNLLISQAQILRVISHLAEQLSEQELNDKRKTWLADLANRYEAFYSLVYERITLA